MFGGTLENLDHVGVDVGRGEGIASRSVCESYQACITASCRGLSRLRPGIPFPDEVIVGSASFRSWPRSMKVSRMSCWTLR